MMEGRILCYPGRLKFVKIPPLSLYLCIFYYCILYDLLIAPTHLIVHTKLLMPFHFASSVDTSASAIELAGNSMGTARAGRYARRIIRRPCIII